LYIVKSMVEDWLGFGGGSLGLKPQPSHSRAVGHPGFGAPGGLGAAENRDLAGEKLTPPQLAEAQKWAREWKPKAAGGTRQARIIRRRQAMDDAMVLGLTLRISVDYYGSRLGKTNILN